MRCRSPGSACLAAFLIATADCGDRRRSEGTTAPPAPAASPESPPAPKSLEPPPRLLGIWTVVDHHMPGVGAMSDAAARKRYGRTLRLTEAQAVSDGNHCNQPAYSSHTVPTDSFLAAEYNLPPRSLASLISIDRTAVLEVSCGGTAWTTMGARLIEVAPDRALAPWDGVFFELARDHDVRALGQEPFWGLEIHKGQELRFTYALGTREAVTPDPGAEIGAGGRRTYHAVTEANDLRVVVAPKPCTDVMSGNPFRSTVTVTLNGQRYDGCGGPME